MHGESDFAPVIQPAIERLGRSLSDPEDKAIPAFAAVLGTLTAVACLGFSPSSEWKRLLGYSFATGLILVNTLDSDLPAFNSWLTPLVSLAGGASVAVSVRRTRPGTVDG